MSADLQAQIKIYLEDETKLYQDLFQRINPQQRDPNFTQVASSDKLSLQELRSNWQDWFERKREEISRFVRTKPFSDGETLCQRWQRLREKYPGALELITVVFADISVPITEVHLYHTPVFFLTLLVTDSIDKLCYEPEYVYQEVPS